MDESQNVLQSIEIDRSEKTLKDMNKLCGQFSDLLNEFHERLQVEDLLNVVLTTVAAKHRRMGSLSDILSLMTGYLIKGLQIPANTNKESDDETI